MGVNDEHFKITIFLKSTTHFTNFIFCYFFFYKKGIYFVAFEDIASPLLCRQIERIEFTICQSGNLISKKECQQNLFLVQKIYWTQSTFTANGTLQIDWVRKIVLRKIFKFWVAREDILIILTNIENEKFCRKIILSGSRRHIQITVSTAEILVS